MKRLLSVFLAAMFVLAGVALSKPALAEDTDYDDEGFSAYTVARLKIFQGTAWVRSPDSGEWEETTTNSPITEKSRVNVPEGSEAELQFHGGQFVLLTGGSEVDIRKLDEGNSVFGLRSGEIRFDLPAEDFSPVRMVIPGGGKVDFNVPGRYWLTAQDSGRTRLVVRSGEGAVTVSRGNFSVKAGQEASIGEDVRIAAYENGGGEPYATPAPMTEEERQADVPPAAAYELRDYGDWVYSADYGWVWQPRVATGWSPYYYGRWAWVSPYGWTWVSYEPWGWYPYHYGWWYSDPFFGWVWCPFHSFVSVSFVFGHTHFTHFHHNAFFFPANVRFVRDGRTVRWAPLRPGERFVRPGFTRTDARLARVDRPLERGAVYTRTQVRGKTEWREFSSAQRGQRTVSVRERGSRQGVQGTRQPAVRTGDSPDARPQAERSAPPRQEQRMQQRAPDRPAPQREYRGRGSRLGEKAVSPQERKRPETRTPVRTERVNVPRPDWGNRVEHRRDAPPARAESARPVLSPARNTVPGRGFARPEGGGGAIRTPAARGEIRGQAVRNPSWSGAGMSNGGRGETAGNRSFGGGWTTGGGDRSFGGSSFGGGGRSFGEGGFRGGGFGGGGRR